MTPLSLGSLAGKFPVEFRYVGPKDPQKVTGRLVSEFVDGH